MCLKSVSDTANRRVTPRVTTTGRTGRPVTSLSPTTTTGSQTAVRLHHGLAASLHLNPSPHSTFMKPTHPPDPPRPRVSMSAMRSSLKLLPSNWFPPLSAPPSQRGIRSPWMSSRLAAKGLCAKCVWPLK